jgi:hypothetical protein
MPTARTRRIDLDPLWTARRLWIDCGAFAADGARCDSMALTNYIDGISMRAARWVVGSDPAR